MKGDSAWLASVIQVEYYLDPTYKTSKRVVTQATGGKYFTLCCNGWGEFIIRIKIVFKNAFTPSINETYKLDLKSPAKKKISYRCP
jgi:transcription initiation factor IIF auxiliary subunit